MTNTRNLLSFHSAYKAYIKGQHSACTILYDFVTEMHRDGNINDAVRDILYDEAILLRPIAKFTGWDGDEVPWAKDDVAALEDSARNCL